MYNVLRGPVAGLLLVLALAPMMASCDAVEAGTFPLPDRRVTFEFRFQGNALTPGIFNEVISENQVDLRAYVESRGFAASDVVAARVRPGSAQLRVARPLTAGVNSFTRLEVRTFQGTAVGSTIVSGSGFSGTGDTAPLEIRTSNFGDIVATGPFRAQLRIDPVAGVIHNAEYLVEVTFDVVIEVEG